MKDRRVFSDIFRLTARPAARACMCLALAASAWAWGLPAAQAQQQTNAAVQMTAVQAQASSEGGWNLRVKGMAAQPDHTVLDVAVSFANQRRPQGAQLAGGDTFLLTDGGTRLLLKRPAEDANVPIANNASMEGQLTFLGAIPVGTQQLTLVVNEGNGEQDTRAPALKLPIAVPPEVQSQLRVHSVGADAAKLAADVRYPVQANNEGGLLVQVQSVQREADRTRLQVSIAFSNRRRPRGTELAGGETFLRTAAGDRLMLQRSADNPKLLIANNEAMVGELVFQGALPADAQGLTLVINDGHSATSTRASALVMALPAP